MSDRFPFMAAMLAMALCLPALRMGFFADDYMQRATFLQPPGLEGMFGEPFADFFSFADGDPERMDLIVDKGMWPWIVDREIRIRFWRPVTVATHWIDYQLWPNSAVMMHIHNLLWFGAMVLAAGFFYRRMMGPGLLAGLALLLFAIDDAHGWPAAWIANRNGPVALLLSLFVLTLHDRWRREGQTSAAIAGVGILAFALLAKESSISTCGYLFAYALFLDKAPLRSRVLSLTPYAAVVLIWRAVYVHLNYGAEGSGAYIDPARNPLQFLEALATRIPLLLQGQWWFPPSDYYTFSPPFLQPFFVTIAIIGSLILVPLLYTLVRRDPIARFWCLGMLLALLPVAAGGTQDRLLLFAGLGAMGLLAQFFIEFKKGTLFDASSAIGKWFARPAYYGLVFLHFMLAPFGLVLVILTLTWINDNTIMAAQDSLPENPEIVDQTFIFMNIGPYPIATYLFIIRGSEDRPVPAHVRSLANESMVAVPTKMTRTGAHTLVVEPEGGHAWSLFRDEDHALALGDKMELTGMTVEITTLAEGGWPESITYTFDKELEDPSLVWFLLVGFDLVESKPPEIGETVFYNPTDLFRESLKNKQ